MKTENTSFHCARIATPAQFARTLNAGPYAWPGGYPLYFVCADGEPLSFAAAKENAALICAAIRDAQPHFHDEWNVVACEVNYEDAALYCAHTGERIESAYAEDDAQPTNTVNAANDETP